VERVPIFHVDMAYCLCVGNCYILSGCAVIAFT